MNDVIIEYENKYKILVPSINSEFEFINIKEFRNNLGSTTITILHKPCGRVIDIRYGNFQMRKNCKYCTNHRYDTQGFINRFNEREDSDDYIIMSDFISITSPVRLKHKLCGKEFDIRADTLIYSNGQCPCVYGKYGNKPYTFELLNKRIKEKNSDYELVEIDSEPVKILKDHVKIKHIPCGTIFKCIPHNFFSYNNKECPTCKTYPTHALTPKDSKGVIIIESWIKDKKLYYEREKKFDNLVSPSSGRPLRYDFFIPDLNLIIEFDGKQHFDTRTNSIFTKEKYDKIRLHDKIKNKYCKRYRINLIRIKYTDSTKEYIYNKLNNFFNKEVRIYFMTNYD